MIYLHLSDLLLTPPVTHTSTDWQVARDLQFTQIEVESIGDVNNLTSKMFDNALDPELKYYARARLLLSTGYTAWSNIDIFTPQDIIDESVHMSLPSIVTLPVISITNNGIDVPLYSTSVSIVSVNSYGAAKHEATSYILEDIDNNVVWSLLQSTDYKLGVDIPADVMAPNSVYRMRIIIHTDSSDTSQVVTTTFKTESRTVGLIMTGTDNVDSTVDLSVDVATENGATGINATLYAYINRVMTQVNTYVGSGVNSNIILIPAADLKPATKYILRVNTDDAGTWDQRVFTTEV